MISPNRIFISSFAAASLLCVAALADTTTPTPTTPPQKEVKVECRFNGGGSDKSAGWSKRCRAEAKFKSEDNASSLNQDEGHLKVTCFDGDEDQDDRPIYNDGLRTFFDRDDETLLLKGIRNHHDGEDDQDNDRRPPRILISDVERRDLCRGDRDEERRFAADLSFSQEGFVFDIPGTCRIKCEDNHPLLN